MGTVGGISIQLSDVKYLDFLKLNYCTAKAFVKNVLINQEKSKCLGIRGNMFARLKLKEIDGMAPPGVEPAA